MFFLVFVLFLDCFFNMHLCAKLQPYRSKIFDCTVVVFSRDRAIYKSQGTISLYD